MKMNICLLFLVMLFNIPTLRAQDAGFLLKEGIALSTQQNYVAALNKFMAAYKLEPDNPLINYQVGFALNASGKAADALPYLQKVISAKAPAQITGSAFELMGAIYDRMAKIQKAIASYQQGIRADSSSVSIRYNLGLAYFRDHQYQKAEQNAVTVISMQPENASAYRLYALVCFHQDKRAAALIGFCSFLYLEPNGALSAEAYGNIRHILAGGTLKPAAGEQKPSAEIKQLNLLITKAVAAATPQGKQTAVQQFIAQLDAVFMAINTAKHDQDSFFQNLLAYYTGLAKSGNLPAFGYTISQSVDKSATVWLQNHQQETENLKAWIKTAGN